MISEDTPDKMKEIIRDTWPGLFMEVPGRWPKIEKTPSKGVEVPQKGVETCHSLNNRVDELDEG
jgi:hypothetical protein